ncbi:class II glutamine amidotransferase [Brachybacterium saurashtrense]|uniref:Class II glutamine amidotransferase n=1 Tax=Brachybacterium saurashtrense TaxID=556288 RepID=A0A345YR44_9MICO|nr:class II glutamine amidotransferase [Brachybacterium saurashtrense]AXK46396.1 class II glutamine amidotransferase [Brachybacterium saurashtrense]RRR24137.1 class II glutamine amidotransferase [Brachybacterium saurashtrense]
MCRLLGVVSRGALPLTETVPAELPLFTALSERHKDGWGVASYPPGTGADGDDQPAPDLPLVRRGTDTARASGAYGRAVAEARGEVVAVHLRRASVGLALELANTHPFVEQGVTFSHNGQFDLSAVLRERLLARGGRTPAGTTDSELFFSLITAWSRELPAREGRPDWAAAIQHAAAELTALTQELFGRPPESLNCLLTTPGTLVAYAQHDPAQAPADQPVEVYDLRWRADHDRVLVSSTGYPQPGFETLAQGAALTVHQGTLRVERHPAPALSQR